MKYILSIILFFGFLFGKAQEPKTFPVDTSFTLYSAWQKELKRYPQIKPVYPVVPSGVKVKNDLVYANYNGREMHINPDKIVISGTSAGGQLAALIGATNGTALFIDSTHYPEFSSDVQAVIDIDGILAFVHPESGEGADQPGKPSAATLWFGGNKDEKKEHWNEASALNHVDNNMPPVLFINSQHPRFHAGRDDMIQILDSLGIYSKVHTLPDTPHPFWLFDPWFEPTVKWMEQFLEKVLTP